MKNNTLKWSVIFGIIGISVFVIQKLVLNNRASYSMQLLKEAKEQIVKDDLGTARELLSRATRLSASDDEESMKLLEEIDKFQSYSFLCKTFETLDDSEIVSATFKKRFFENDSLNLRFSKKIIDKFYEELRLKEKRDDFNRKNKGVKISTERGGNKKKLVREIDGNELKITFGGNFAYKSLENDKEINGVITQTNYETTYHIFDIPSRKVILKYKLNDKWLSVSYPFNGFYLEEGLLATTYVLKVNTLGVKEIWFTPETSNLGYDFLDGSRISCYKISKVE